MYKVFDERCDEHYIVKENNGYIEIYTEDENGILSLLEKTDMSTEYLTNTDRENLLAGIKIHGRTELEKLLEDYE